MNLIEYDQTYLKNDFIRGWYASDTSICDDLIRYFEESGEKKAGMVSGGIKPEIKSSTDVMLEQGDIFDKYIQLLNEVVHKYIKIYPMVNYYSPWNLTEIPNVQKYNPTEAYYGWHTERVSGFGGNAARHMVFMTYLNDVLDGGETEFYHQNLKVKPVKGLTLIWPADWTFTHRGCPAPKEDKYIVTGWLSYVA